MQSRRMGASVLKLFEPRFDKNILNIISVLILGGHWGGWGVTLMTLALGTIFLSRGIQTTPGLRPLTRFHNTDCELPNHFSAMSFPAQSDMKSVCRFRARCAHYCRWVSRTPGVAEVLLHTASTHDSTPAPQRRFQIAANVVMLRRIPCRHCPFHNQRGMLIGPPPTLLLAQPPAPKKQSRRRSQRTRRPKPLKMEREKEECGGKKRRSV